MNRPIHSASAAQPEFAALTMASTRILVMSPTTKRSFFPCGKSISMPLMVQPTL
jgi:hypothetical protein